MKQYYLITQQQWQDLQKPADDSLLMQRDTPYNTRIIDNIGFKQVRYHYRQQMDEIIHYCVKHQDECKNLYPTLEKLGLYYGNNTYNKDEAKFSAALREALSSERAVLLEKPIEANSGMLPPEDNFLRLPSHQIARPLSQDEIYAQKTAFLEDNNYIEFTIYDLPNHPFTVFDNASQKIVGQGTLDSSGYAYVKLTPEVKYVDVVFDKQQQSRPWYYDVPLQFVGGLRDMAQSTIDLVWDTSVHKSMTTIIARDTVNNPIQIPVIPQAETVAGSLTHGMTQFLAAFIPVARQLKVIAPLKNMGKLSRGMVAGGIADYTAFAPHEERLSNLIQSFPELQNPVTEYLQAKPDDSNAEGRFKNALEGLMLGALTETFSHSLRALKYARIKWTAFEVKTKVHYKLEASQYAIKDVPESTPNFSAIDGNSKQIAIFMPKLEYEALLNDAIKNSDSNTMVLGKYTRDSSSYLAVAKENNAMYFDMGDKWGKIKNTYNLTDDSMFKLFNLPALDDAIKNGKTIQFTHDPVYDRGALGKELKYLIGNGYEFDPITLIATPLK